MSAAPDCSKVKCGSMSVLQQAGNPCCGSKNLAHPIRAPGTTKRNSETDTRTIIQKVQQDGPSAGGKPGDEEGRGGGGTGDSAKCKGCDAGNIGCEIGKLSCEMTSAAGDSLPMIALGVGAVIVLLLVLK